MRAISPQDKRTTFITFFKKTLAFLQKIRARWKTHSSRDSDLSVLVIKQIALAPKWFSVIWPAPN